MVSSTNTRLVVIIITITLITSSIGIFTSVKLEQLIKKCNFDALADEATKNGLDSVTYGTDTSRVDVQDGTFMKIFGNTKSIIGYSIILGVTLLIMLYLVTQNNSSMPVKVAGTFTLCMGVYTVINSWIVVGKYYSNSEYGTYYDKISMCKKEICGVVKDVSGSCNTKGEDKCSKLQSGMIDYDFHSTKTAYTMAGIMGTVTLICSISLWIRQKNVERR